jgi:hypothetical protein
LSVNEDKQTFQKTNNLQLVGVRIYVSGEKLELDMKKGEKLVLEPIRL